MIIDRIKNASLYFGVHERLAAGLRWLQAQDAAKLTPGRHELDGSNLFVLVSEYETKPKDQGKWEAHKRYFDIQYLIEGREAIGYAELGACKLGTYDEAKDLQPIAEAPGDFLNLRAGMFMILAPQDAHMPGLAAMGSPEQVKKAVVKVLV
jgi:YhcH/YjgK/YiaL family protein